MCTSGSTNRPTWPVRIEPANLGGGSNLGSALVEASFVYEMQLNIKLKIGHLNARQIGT